LMTEVEQLVRSAKIGRRLLVVVVGLTCLGTVYAIAVNVNQGADITNVHNDVTKVERSACAKDPTHPSAECEEIRRQVDRHESIVGACIQHQRVTGTRGRNCPRFYIDVADQGEPGPSSAVGGDAPQSPSTATQPPAPGHPAPPGAAPPAAGPPGAPRRPVRTRHPEDLADPDRHRQSCRSATGLRGPGNPD